MRVLSDFRIQVEYNDGEYCVRLTTLDNGETRMTCYVSDEAFLSAIGFAVERLHEDEYAFHAIPTVRTRVGGGG